jgi:hypothetical protein
MSSFEFKRQHMKWLRNLAPILLAGRLVLSAAISDPAPVNPEGGSGEASSGGVVKLTATLPPVLRPLEPTESRRLVLPGPPKPAKPVTIANPVNPAPAAEVPNVKPVQPVAKMAVLPTKLVPDPILRQPLPRIPAAAPPPPPVKPAMPPDLEREIALYCQKQIGHWKEADAWGILGNPKRQRPAYDEKRSVNGTIYAFSDPTGRYKDMELDFDRESGTLRTVFVYPPSLTWQDCRRKWAGPFTSADAREGRMFYSYTNRRLDVLVDAAGKVVSLGWY